MEIFDIYDIYNLSLYIANRDFWGNSFSIDKFNLIIKNVNIEYFNKRYGIPLNIKNRQVIDFDKYEETQHNTDSLRKFKVVMGENSSPLFFVDGIAKLPEDYCHVSSVRYKGIIDKKSKKDYTDTIDTCGNEFDKKDDSDKYIIKYRNVDILFDHEISNRFANSNRTPSLKYPVCTFVGDNVYVYPKEIKSLIFTYLRYPKTPYLAYSLDTNDQIVYDKDKSIQFEYNDFNFIDIVNLILSYIGINLTNKDISQYAEAQKIKL